MVRCLAGSQEKRFLDIYWMDLKVSCVTPPCIATICTKGNNFCNFPLQSLDNVAFSKMLSSLKKEFALSGFLRVYPIENRKR